MQTIRKKKISSPAPPFSVNFWARGKNPIVWDRLGFSSNYDCATCKLLLCEQKLV